MDATNPANQMTTTLAQMIDEILQKEISLGCTQSLSITTYLDLCTLHNEWVSEEYRVKLRAAMKAIRAMHDGDDDLVLALDAKLGKAINGLQERALDGRLITVRDLNEQSLIEAVQKERERRKEEYDREQKEILAKIKKIISEPETPAQSD